MAFAMRYRTVRRLTALGVVGALAYGVSVYHTAWAAAAGTTPARFTGWALLGLMGGLMVLALRKRITRLPLGRMYHWVTIHVYLGLLVGGLLLVHIGFAWPGTALNQALLVCFLVAWGSGVMGLALSRAIPVRLHERGEVVIYERIPAHRHRLRQHLLAMVEEGTAGAVNGALASYTLETLVPFFEAPRHRLAHLLGRSRHRRRMLLALDTLGRSMNPRDRQTKDALADLVRAKDDLDFMQVHQAVLKYWLFVHVPLSYALLVFVVIHVAWALIFH